MSIRYVSTARCCAMRGMVLCGIRYAMCVCGTEIAYGAMRCGGTELAYGTTQCTIRHRVWCDAMRGNEIAYVAMRCAVLR
eukprot:3941924-Rhodomonas_salina.2